MYIQENLKEIRVRMEAAAEESGRTISDITLIGVTKTIDTPRIQDLVNLGVKDLGENRVQELMDKVPNIEGSPNWHLIGHLQTNKVKYVLDSVNMIHSIDSEKLVLEIHKQALKRNLTVDILMEINIANEHTKFGISVENSLKLAKFIDEFNNIRLKGLMTVAPYVENPNKNAKYFQHMREVFIDIRSKINNNKYMQFLSMGMSNDYEVAIREGSNMIRIGTGIFGNRNYK